MFKRDTNLYIGSLVFLFVNQILVTVTYYFVSKAYTFTFKTKKTIPTTIRLSEVYWV